MPAPLDTSTDALRHVLVTLADRFEHALGDAPAGFAAPSAIPCPLAKLWKTSAV